MCLSVFSLPLFLCFPSLSGFHLVFYSKQIHFFCVQLKMGYRNFGLLRHLPLNEEKKNSDRNLSNLRFLYGI